MKLKFSKLEVNSDSITINFGNETKTYDNVKNWSKDYEIEIQDSWLVKNDKGEFDFSKIVISTDVSTFKQDSVKFMITDGLTGGDLKKVYIVKVYINSGFYQYAFIDEDLNFSNMDSGGYLSQINDKYKIYRGGELTYINKNDIDNFENEVIYINIADNIADSNTVEGVYAPAVLATYIDKADLPFKLKVSYTAEESTESDDGGEYTYTMCHFHAKNLTPLFRKTNIDAGVFIRANEAVSIDEGGWLTEVDGNFYLKIDEYGYLTEDVARVLFSEDKSIYLIPYNYETHEYTGDVEETNFVFPSYEDWELENI